MKILIRIAMGLVLFIFVFAGFVTTSFSMKSSQVFNAPKFSISEEVAKADIELGKRMYTVRNGCIDCHGENLAGNKIMENGAMGSIYGANLTTLKSWTNEEIATAIRYGINKEGRSLRFMPVFDFENLSKSDVAALVAYIRSAPEVNQPRHENTFGPIARVMSVMGQMPVMFPALVIDSTKGFQDKPQEGPTPEFGKYLANSCTGCHGHEFRGGKIPGGDPSWPEAANIRLGANANWDEAKFNSLIDTGVSPLTNQQIRAPMPVNLMKQMNDFERKALWAYLSTLN